MKKPSEVFGLIENTIIYEFGKIKHQRNRSRVKLGDGTVLSIQASEHHYCTPRKNGLGLSQYKSVEVGFPSNEIEEFFPWAEEEGDWTDTVYPYLPLEVLVSAIESRGGIVKLIDEG